MKIVDNGVLEPSYMDFSIPSEFAKISLYCSPQSGHFYCNNQYKINRKSLDQFLFIYVCGGSLHIEMNEKEITACQDQIALLDCRSPHRYYCSESVEFLWFHFNGCSSIQYAELLLSKFGIIFSGEHIPELRKYFETVISNVQSTMVNEHFISLNISQILSRLAVPEKHKFYMNHLLNPAIHYISKSYDKMISVDDLSRLCNISTSHFIRSFKKYANCTPHEYLLSYRLRQAKQHLLYSHMTIEQIAEECGFNSASHFARAFRKSEGITPSQFRNMQF